MRDPNSFYVYVLYRDDDRPFYVGKGRGRRIFYHEKLARTEDQSHKSRLIRAVWLRGGTIRHEKIAEDLTNESAIEIEIATISQLGREPVGPLINQTRGGDGLVLASPDLHALIGMKLRGRKMSPEACAKMSASRKGFKLSADAIARGAAKRTGQKRTAATRAKMSAAKKGKPGRVPSAATVAAMIAGRKPWSDERRAAKSIEKRGKIWFTPATGSSYQAREPRHPSDKKGRRL